MSNSRDGLLPPGSEFGACQKRILAAREALAEQTDLTHAAPDGTVTLLFTDIEGSTALNERLGDQRWMDVLREHNAVVRDEIAAHGGYEVKSQGDGFMMAFGRAQGPPVRDRHPARV